MLTKKKSREGVATGSIRVILDALAGDVGSSKRLLHTIYGAWAAVANLPRWLLASI
jgi:hypothetical protein